MSLIPDGTTTDTWLKRAQAEDLPLRHQDGDAGYAAKPPSGGPTQGWDPYEVWLSRIERPRRRRASFPGA